jgi:hypothetical protein
MAIVYRPEDLEHVRLRMAWYRVEGDADEIYRLALMVARETPWPPEFESRGLEADGDGDGDPTIEKIIALLQADVGA